MKPQKSDLSMVPEHLQSDAEIAFAEGRLAWRCTDSEGRPANRGKAEPLPIGEWSPRQEPVLCKSGWHTTSEPHRWMGQAVWLVEGRELGGIDDDKSVWAQIRPLARVDPATCTDPQVLVRASGGNLRGADLRGANLREASLRGANLQEANLWGADLREADLQEADLRGVDLGGANLREANLQEANLQEATGRDDW